jgi:hypothetical protein
MLKRFSKSDAITNLRASPPIPSVWHFHKSLWPTQEQALLLTAALEQGPKSLRAWDAWSAGVDFDGLDAASQRLIPLLYRNLKDQGIEGPLMQRMKGIYRRTWWHNQLLFRRLAEVLAKFEEAEIPSMILKGSPLSLTVYEDMGLRPMNDLDIAVPVDALQEVTRILRQLGGVAKEDNFSIGHAISHAISYYFADKSEIDVHVSVMKACHAPQFVEPLWAASIPVQHERFSTRTLCAADQLLHTIAHGINANALAPIRWIADTIWILRKNPDLDWERLLARSQAMALSLVLREGLTYIAKHHTHPIPLWVLDRLAERRPLLLERLEFNFGRRDSLLSPLGFDWATYARRHPDQNGLSIALGTLRDIHLRYGATSLRKTFVVVVSQWLTKYGRYFSERQFLRK